MTRYRPWWVRWKVYAFWLVGKARIATTANGTRIWVKR